MTIRRSAIYLLILGVIALAFGGGYIAYPLLHGANLPPSSLLLQTLGGQNMDVYWEAWKLLDRDFYGEKPDNDERTYGAVRGMVKSFDDPYTYFVEPMARELERDEIARQLRRHRRGDRADGGRISSLRPSPGQPAAEAGVLDGDLLLMVDDREITPELSIDEVVGLIRGPVGTQVVLLVRRDRLRPTTRAKR